MFFDIQNEGRLLFVQIEAPILTVALAELAGVLKRPTSQRTLRRLSAERTDSVRFASKLFFQA